MTLYGPLSLDQLKERHVYTVSRAATFARGSSPSDAYRNEGTRLQAMINEVRSKQEPMFIAGTIYSHQPVDTRPQASQMYDSLHAYDVNWAPTPSFVTGGEITPAPGDVAAGKVVYLDSSGTMRLGQPDDLDASTVVGIAVAGGFVAGGAVRGYTGLLPGAIYYLDADGGISETPPSTDGEWVVRIGTAVDSTTLSIEVGEEVGL